jgi:hypothetical protein
MQMAEHLNPAVSFAFHRLVVGLAQSHDHGLSPCTSRRALPSRCNVVASASRSLGAPLCPGFALTSQAPLKLAGITRRSRGRQLTPWLLAAAKPGAP